MFVCQPPAFRRVARGTDVGEEAVIIVMAMTAEGSSGAALAGNYTPSPGRRMTRGSRDHRGRIKTPETLVNRPEDKGDGIQREESLTYKTQSA